MVESLHPDPPERVQTDMHPGDPMLEPEELLQNLGGLRHLAVALVGAAEADDLPVAERLRFPLFPARALR